MPTIHAPLHSFKHPENGRLESSRNASYRCIYLKVSERLFGFHIHLDESPSFANVPPESVVTAADNFSDCCQSNDEGISQDE